MMSLEVLLQAAQYVDRPISRSGSGRGGVSPCPTHVEAAATGGSMRTSLTTTASAEDSRSSSCQPTGGGGAATTSRASGGLYAADFRDAARMSSAGYYQSSRHCSSRHSESDDEVDNDTQQDEDLDEEHFSDHQRKRPSHKTSSGHRSSSSDIGGGGSWKNRSSEKNKRIVMKHNTENRSVHNVLEKNRRAHLKDCFEALKQEVLEGDDEKKASHLAVLKNAVRCIQILQKESEKLQNDTERLSKERSAGQHRLQELKRDILSRSPNFDIAGCLHDAHDEVDSQITCTAPGSPPPPVGRYSASPQHQHQMSHSTTAFEIYSTFPASPHFTSHTTASLDSPTDIQLMSVPKSRKKRTNVTAGPAGGASEPHRTRKPCPAKISVAAILHQARTTPPPAMAHSHSSLSPPSSSASSSRDIHFPRSPGELSSNTTAMRRHLPIKLRILQDQHEGLFTANAARDSPMPNREIDDRASGSSPPPPPPPLNAGMKPLLYPAGDIPIPAVFSHHSAPSGGAFWSTTADGSFAPIPTAFFGVPQAGFVGGTMPPMYQMNQFLVPISMASNGLGGSGGGMTMGQLPSGSLFMMPTVSGGAPAMFHCGGQLPSIHQLPLNPKRPPS